ncbi:toll/interleukin-1 receptor domain-containing protein [Arenibacter certesii]|uniref:TIR domain-containing protein n=1 Tax=Arenibacter certesii TaxID=228955 RepID=A0A918IXR2_9FLAO|nr:toll/interleukin-1 receptor domain-containing protein [Arenibacter certesii]GGW37092.1 hypothetical protein GCM10007383_22440 [Arenibacter certesii]
MQKSSYVPSIYISYAWGSESEAIAEAVEKEFQKRGLRIIRDKNDLGYKGRIKDFMEQIGRGKYVILIISNKYLRSENCMFELLQIFENRDFYERIFPVVLDEVKIAKAVDRLDLLKYWENETENLNNKIKELKELSNIQGVTDDLNLYTAIRGNIARLTHILKDINTLNTDRHIKSDFKQLYELVEVKVKSDVHDENQNKKEVVGDAVPAEVDRSSLKDKKKDKTKIFKRIALLIAFLLVVVAAFQTITKWGPGNEKEIPLDSTIVKGEKTDSLSDLEAENPETILYKEVVSDDKEEVPVSNIKYDVKLIVPSTMAQATVLVDGKRAEIIDRGLISITVRITKKAKSHHFEINDGLDKCATDILINKDNVQLTLCN